MVESLFIINQLLIKLSVKSKKFNKFKLLNSHNLINGNQNLNNFINMEQTIKHFKYWSEGFLIKNGLIYIAVESPKGEFGITLISNNTNKPYRCKIKSPAYSHLQILPKLIKNHLLADLVTIMGTIDIVFGEIDR